MQTYIYIYMSSRSVKNVVLVHKFLCVYLIFLGRDGSCEQNPHTSDCCAEISCSVSGDIYMLLLGVALQHYRQPFSPLFV